MTELDALLIADTGRANYATDRLMTDLGHAGLWDLKQVGVERVEPYVAQGNFLVDSWPIFRSYLTDSGKERLRELQAAATDYEGAS